VKASGQVPAAEKRTTANAGAFAAPGLMTGHGRSDYTIS